MAERDAADPAARLLAEFSPRLYRYALVRLGRNDLAEDAVAEVLCRLVEKGPSLHGPTPHVHGWCVRCLVNVCREIARRPRADSATDLSDRATNLRFSEWVTAVPGGLDTRMLASALAQLSERQSEAVTLRVLMGLPVGAVARAMQCAEGTVKALTHQGLASLRTRLTRLTEDAG